MLELSEYVDTEMAKNYRTVVETILRNISSGHYTAAIGTNGGFILKHSVGSKPQGTEVDVLLTILWKL